MIALWYAARATGEVALLFLTIVTVFGALTAARAGGRRVPRFVLAGLHRNLTLAGLCFLAVHILTVVADTYVRVDLVDAVLPFVSSYRPFWLGLGAIAFDLLVVLTLTSLLRTRIGHRTWRALHWAAYACWPLALAHGLGAGSDTGTSLFLILDGVAGALVLAAVAWRATTTPPGGRLSTPLVPQVPQRTRGPR